MSSYLISGRKEDCCGCHACENVCHYQAIDMIADEEGFSFPIKNDRCVNCGLCEIVCPYNTISIEKEKNKRDNDNYPKTYAAYSEQDRIGSSSGGIFYALAKHIISKKGTVYGAAFDKNFQLHHIAANTIEELEPLRGSKYLQSNIGTIFPEILTKLKNNEDVFFVGTPCQVAGLKSFLRKDFETLLSADLICHGTPSQWMFDQHHKYLEEKHGAKLLSYHFRDEELWGGCEICKFINQRTRKIKTIKAPTYELSPYLYSFMYAFDYRLSCYECPFAKVPRQGDITLGDYWGIQKVFPQMDTNHGISAILINTQQGEHYWNAIKDSLVYEVSDYRDVALENKNLIDHTQKPDIRKNVYWMVKERGYADVAKHEFRSPRFRSIKRSQILQKIGVWKLMVAINHIIKKTNEYFKKTNKSTL